MVTAIIMFGQIMYLCMAVVARGYCILCPGGLNLVKLKLAIFTALLGKSRLQKTTTAAATVVVRLVGCHIDEVFCANNLFDNIAQIVCYRVAKGFSYQLAGILYCKLDFQILVPVGIDRQFSFPYPFGVILDY